MQLNQSAWHIIIIKDQPGVLGASLIKVIEIIRPYCNLSKGILDDDLQGITGSKLDFFELVDLNQGILSIQKLEDFLSEVSLEWGNIFLFNQVPDNWEDFPESDPIQRISQTEVTVRAADQGYILIYTKDPFLFELLKPVFPNAIIESGPLDELWYPE